MKAVISSTYDDNYFFFLPIVKWCWNKLGVDCIFMLPAKNQPLAKTLLVSQYIRHDRLFVFDCPEHKTATYAQCSRLYAAALYEPDAPYEIFITSDVDMAVFGLPILKQANGFFIFGSDLVPPKQFPICYLSANADRWKETFNIGDKTVQECLDELLGDLDCENMRGNFWSKDQEEAYNKISPTNPILLPRARPGTQFATNRIDRDDAYWEDRLTPEIFDAHLWRPGYTEENFAKILKLLTFMYPIGNFDWLVQYRNEYLKLL